MGGGTRRRAWRSELTLPLGKLMLELKVAKNHFLVVNDTQSELQPVHQDIAYDGVCQGVPLLIGPSDPYS